MEPYAAPSIMHSRGVLGLPIVVERKSDQKPRVATKSLVAVAIFRATELCAKNTEPDLAVQSTTGTVGGRGRPIVVGLNPERRVNHAGLHLDVHALMPVP